MKWARLVVLLLALPFCVVFDMMLTVPCFLFFGAMALVQHAAGQPDQIDMVWFWLENSLIAWWARGVRRAWGSR